MLRGEMLTSCALAHCSRSVWCWGIRSSHSSGGPADARSTLTNLRRARDVFEKRRTLGSTDSYCPCTHQDPATDHLLVQTIEESCAA